MARVYLKKSKVKIVMKKPKNSVLGQSTKHIRYYYKGSKKYAKAKKGSQLRYE